MVETQMETKICNVAFAQNQYVKKKFNAVSVNVFSTAPVMKYRMNSLNIFLKSSNFIFNCNNCNNKKNNVNVTNNEITEINNKISDMQKSINELKNNLI